MRRASLGEIICFSTLLMLTTSCIQSGATGLKFTTGPASTSTGGGSGSGTNSNGSGSSSCSSTSSVQVSWNANHEKSVNMTGGGYKVYYSTRSPVNTSTDPYVNVPYSSGSSAPTSTTVSGLGCGTYHFRVVAYSALHPAGGTGNSRSPDSSEVSISVP